MPYPCEILRRLFLSQQCQSPFQLELRVNRRRNAFLFSVWTTGSFGWRCYYPWDCALRFIILGHRHLHFQRQRLKVLPVLELIRLFHERWEIELSINKLFPYLDCSSTHRRKPSAGTRTDRPMRTVGRSPAWISLRTLVWPIFSVLATSGIVRSSGDSVGLLALVISIPSSESSYGCSQLDGVRRSDSMMLEKTWTNEVTLPGFLMMGGIVGCVSMFVLVFSGILSTAERAVVSLDTVVWDWRFWREP